MTDLIMVVNILQCAF